MAGMISPRGFNETTFPRALFTFDWLEGYFKTQALQAEMEELTKERNRIGAAPLPKTDRLEGLKASFAAHNERRQAVIREVLAHYTGHGDALKYVGESMHVGNKTLHLPPLIEWKEIMNAFESVPETPGAISQKDREKATAKLAKRIGEVEAEIETAFPERWHGPNHADGRGEFVRMWAKIQGQCNAPVTPEGWSLEKHGNEGERAAWKKLKLGDFINLKGLEPYEE